MPSFSTIVIVGAGFSGTIVAAQLLRGAAQARVRLRVVLVNRSGRTARGVAYGTRSELHVLNVPAGRMSALPDDEESFVRFAREYDPSITSGAFVPRRLYGEYLDELLVNSARTAAPLGTLEQWIGEVVDVMPLADRGARVVLADGRICDADYVVFGLGNYAPAHPRGTDDAFHRSDRYVADPWAQGALDGFDADDEVLLLGTGLTMLDVTLALRTRGLRGTIHAVSRRGLLPQAHRNPSVPPTIDHRPPEIESGPATAKAYLHAVRGHVRQLAARSVDWREVIGSLRAITPALWQRLDVVERARFLRHVRPYWEVHRHRAAPVPHAAVMSMIAQGAVRVLAARVRELTATSNMVHARLKPRAFPDDVSLRVHRVVNCTGPEADVRMLDDPLIAALRGRGLVRPDAIGVGFDVSDNDALVGADGVTSSVLFLVGPLLKGAFWEATAVPELRQHAELVAKSILKRLQLALAA